jgi:NitT/TauT family transport system substrate-binding protein
MFRHLVMLISALLILAACSAPPAATTGRPTASQPVGASGQAQAPGGEGNASEFKVAFTSIGVGSVPLLAAIDSLNSQGYKIEVVEIADSDLAIQGVSQGSFAISTAGAPPIAVGQGAKLTVFADRNDNEFTLYATSDIQSCSDLNGRRLAIHSEGATSTAMVRNYIATKCPGTEPEYVVIAGSPNRYAALLAGQIDASPIEVSEAVSLEAEAGDRFHMVTSFADSLPSLHNANVYGNTDFVRQNPATIKALIRALLEQNRKVADDPGYLKQIVQKFWPDVPTETLDPMMARYRELDLFDPNGGLTDETMQATIDFYADAGLIEKKLTVDDLADFSYLEGVLDEIGRR